MIELSKMNNVNTLDYPTKDWPGKPKMLKSTRKTLAEQTAERELEKFRQKPWYGKLGANLWSGTKKLGVGLFNTGLTLGQTAVKTVTKPANLLLNATGIAPGLDRIVNATMAKIASANYGKSFAKTKDVDSHRFPDVLTALEFTLNSYYPDQEAKGWGYIWYNDHDTDSAFCAVTNNNIWQTIVFSFRGTSDWTDALTDINASHAETINKWWNFTLPIPITGASGFIHRIQELGKNGLGSTVEKLVGWCNEYINERKKSMERAETWKRLIAAEMKGTGSIHHNIDDRQIEKIIITGHSLGGAVASIFTAILGQLLPPEVAQRIQLITFEPARGLRQSTVNRLQTNPVMRQIFDNAIFTTTPYDPVPLLPLSSDNYEMLATGFSHVGKNWMLPIETVDAGPVAAHSSLAIADSLKKTFDMGVPNTRIYQTNGKGRLKGKVKRKNKKSTMAMKARMAYVRSFRKK